MWWVRTVSVSDLNVLKTFLKWQGWMLLDNLIRSIQLMNKISIYAASYRSCRWNREDHEKKKNMLNFTMRRTTIEYDFQITKENLGKFLCAAKLFYLYMVLEEKTSILAIILTRKRQSSSWSKLSLWQHHSFSWLLLDFAPFFTFSFVPSFWFIFLHKNWCSFVTFRAIKWWVWISS